MTDDAEAHAIRSPTGFVTYVDENFVTWRVTERDARADPGRRADSCLIFSSPDAVRRVWSYPADWRALSDGALESLSWAL